MRHGGGNYQSQDISAKLGTNVDLLLEKIAIQAELLELKANTNKPAFGAVIEASLDKGEASAIALAIELDNYLLIIDDLKGRKFAHQLGLTIIGTIGVLVDAKLAGIIPSIKPILSKIKSTNFRITEQLELLILKLAGE